MVIMLTAYDLYGYIIKNVKPPMQALTYIHTQRINY